MRRVTDNILPNECKVKTLQPGADDDWTEDVKESRKWGVTGVVVNHSGSHGLCYKVKHDDDGTEAWYTPEELEEI